MFTRIGALVLNRRCSLSLTPCLRTYLSESYKCTQAWENRLQPEYIQKVDLDSLYYDIEQSFNQHGKPSVIDIDIFVNKLNNNLNTDEVSDLLYKLRLTEETSNTLPSTGHAVVRSFLENNYIDELLNLLDDRLNYGVFLDHHTANLLLDDLIKRKDFYAAARIATLLMLQEDFENEICKTLSLYACWRYLEDPKPFYPAPEEPEDGKKSKDEKKVRVRFIRNEFFDDHFDLRDSMHLVGKTLSMIGANLEQKDAAINARMLGEALYHKFDKALLCLNEPKSAFYKDVVLVALKCIEQIPEEKLNDKGHQLKSNLETIASDSSLNQTSFSESIEKLITDAVNKFEKEEISKQESVYKEWMQIRETKLQDEIKRLDRTRRLQEVEKTLESMRKEEQKLWFFENEEKIDLQIDKKKVYYPKRWFGKKKKPRTIDEGYVPPEVRQK